MTRRTNAVATALAAATVLTGAAGGASAVAPTPAAQPTATTMSVHIARHTGAIYRYDTNPDGGGPFAPAVRVSAVLRNCPAGDYLMDATLRQGGRTFAWATGGALGAGEVFCDGDPGTVAARTPLTMSFYGAGLHPGRAVASFSVSPCCGDGSTASATARVWIPRSR